MHNWSRAHDARDQLRLKPYKWEDSMTTQRGMSFVVTSILVFGALLLAPTPTYAAAPANDDFVDATELTVGVGEDIDPAIFDDATAEASGDAPICDFTDVGENLYEWDPDVDLADGACGDGEVAGDASTPDHSATWYFQADEGDAFEVKLVVPNCIAAINDAAWQIDVYQGPDEGDAWLHFASTYRPNGSYFRFDEEDEPESGETYVVSLAVPYDSDIAVSVSVVEDIFGDLGDCAGEEVTLSADDITEATPDNDDISGAQILEFGESIDVDTTYATTNWTDQNPSVDQDYTVKTTWYEWVATDSADYDFNTIGSSCIFHDDVEHDSCSDTVMSVYELDGDSLLQLDENDDCNGYDDDDATLIDDGYLSCISFTAEEGTTYYFQVGLYSYEAEDALIHVEFAPAIPMLEAPPVLTDVRQRTGRGTLASVSNGEWLAGSEISFTYQWLSCRRRLDGDATDRMRSRNCSDIGGATEAQFSLRQGPINRSLRGRFLMAEVTATTDAGSTVAYSHTSSGRIPNR